MRFTNWAKNQSCQVGAYLQPDNEQALITAVQQHKKLRLVGSGHSWSALCLNNEALLNLDRYNRVLEVNAAQCLVTVQAGIKLWQLNNALDQAGLALANLGSIDQQSIAGAICTGTHGTGKEFQILASQAQAFKLIKADGSTQWIRRDENPDLFDLSIVNLGCLGVVSEIQLRVVPAFRLNEISYVASFDDVLAQLEELLATTDHLKFWWFPHTEKIIVYRYLRTNQPANDSRLRQWFMDSFVSVAVYRAMVGVGNLRRNWRQGINRLLVGKFIKPLNRIEKSYKVFRVPSPPKHRETEWAVPIQHTHAVLSEYKRRINSSSHRINFLQELRFSKADNFALSPAFQRDSFWLGGYNIDWYGWENFKNDVQKLALEYNGRPHWGKEFSLSPTYLHHLYPRLSDFLALRRQYDPDGKFVNDFIAQLFGL